MFIVNSLLILSSLTSFLLSLIILVSNPRRRLNQILAINIYSIFFWLVTNLATNLTKDVQIALVIARLTILGPLVFSYTFNVFTKIFKNENHNINHSLLTGIPLVPLFLLTFTKYNIESIDAYGKNTKIGLLYAIATPIAFAYVLSGFMTILSIYKHGNDESKKSQVKLIFYGMILSFVPGVATNAILPLFGNTVSYLYGPNSIIFLAVFMTIAIVRHKFLDIRLIVARAAAYALTLITVAGFYSLFVFVFLANLLGAEKISNTQRTLYSVLAVLFGFSLPPLKRFFDKLTNALFYKDAYDAQVFLDTFNKTLVGNIDLQPLLRESAELIETTLKAEYCLFGIRETDSTPRRIIGTQNTVKFTEEDIQATMAATPHVHQKVIIVDDLEEHHGKLKEILSRNNVAVLARLISSVNQKQGQGYLILGQKKSGNPYNKQDIQVLEIVVNELVIAIQNAMRFEEIQAFNVTLQEKVNEATKQLRKTNEKLKALDETKDEFISMASHQLRTPLTSVKGYVSMVIEGDAGKISKQQHELLGQAFASSQRMVYLIADLLNVSRLRTGKFVIENKPTDLAEVIETEINQLKEAAAGKNQTLTYKKPKSFPVLNMDETKIRQVVMNFTDNALYYTPAGGHITLNLEDKGKTIEFTVVDDGIGVPKAEQHHLFGKFYRAGNAKKARPDGTGLGLFMAKKVIIAQGGAVIFHSEEGKGSTFGFSFAKDRLKVAGSAKQATDSTDNTK